MTKWEAKKEPLYRPSDKVPVIVEVPEMVYAAVTGRGDPNTSEEFARGLEALYGISYAIKMMPKSGVTPPGYLEYTVPPLEGLWDMATGRDFDITRKDELAWTLLIRQPEFVTPELFEMARDKVVVKKGSGNPKIAEAVLLRLTEGTCCQLLHIGPFDDEKASFERMDRFIGDTGYRRAEHAHHEIYLSDFRRVAPEKLRTILRYQVEKA